MFQLVDAPANRPPRGATLIRSANLLPAGDGEWLAGIRYQPDACGGQAVGAARICGSNFAGWDDPSDRPALLDYVPPFVAAGQACSVISGPVELDATQARARRLLDQCETVGIARELWRGDVARAEVAAGDADFPNDYLTKAASLDELNGSASTPLQEAFAWLEAGLAGCSCGGVAMIHASAFTTSLWFGAGLIERNADGRLVSGLGTIIVSDPGYDGSAPDLTVDATNATAWAYGTTMVDVRRGDVFDVGDKRTINRETNDFTVYAVRPFAATFDPCCHVGIKVNHDDRS